MTPDFHIGFDWLDKSHGDAVERATFAQIEIVAGGQSLTEVEDIAARTVRSYIRASAYTLGAWFVSNWWRLRWEPYPNLNPAIDWRMSHDLASAGGGYVWPNIRFVSDGQSVSINSLPTGNHPATPIRFLRHCRAEIDAAYFETGVDAFIDALIERMSGVSALPRDLAETWQAIRDERANPATAQWRRLEARMGFDPDDAPETVISDLATLSDNLGSDAIEEIAAAMGHLAADVAHTLEKVTSRAPMLRIPSEDAMREMAQDERRQSDVPWKQAVSVARRARATWGIDDGPISSSHLCDLLDVPVSLVRNNTRSAPIPAARRTEDDRLAVVLARSSETARRFALARLVGDSLYAPPGDRLLPATEARTARQKFQRAFAQEFLAPHSDLLARVGGGYPSEDALEAVATQFGVSPLLVSNALDNNKRATRGFDLS